MRFWVRYLRALGPEQNDEFGNNLNAAIIVNGFIRQQYLHWLEALNLLGMVADGVLAMVTLATLVRVRTLRILFQKCQGFVLIKL